MDKEKQITKGDRLYVTWEEDLSAPIAIGAATVKSNTVNGLTVAETIVPDLTEGFGVEPKAGQTWLCEAIRVSPSSGGGSRTLVVKPIRICRATVPDDIYLPFETAELIETILSDQSACLMLSGPQGCGKTTIIRKLVTAKGWGFADISGGLIKDMHSMVGRLMPVVSPNNTLMVEYVASQFAAAIIEGGRPENRDKPYVIFIDEILRMGEDPRDAILRAINGSHKFIDLPISPNLKNRSFADRNRLVFFEMMMNIANTVSAIGSKVKVEQAYKFKNMLEMVWFIFAICCRLMSAVAQQIGATMAKLVHANALGAIAPESNLTRLQISDNIRFVAATNRGNAFTLATEDAAHMDRWVICNLDHMPEEREFKHSLRKYPECPADKLMICIKVVNKLRQSLNDPDLLLTKTISTRRVEDCAMFLASGHGLRETLTTAVANQYEGVPANGVPNGKADFEGERVCNAINMLVKELHKTVAKQ